MTSHRPIPSPQRIREYLGAHGWRKGWDILGSGEMFVFKKLDDDGEEITVFVPIHDVYDDYRQRATEIVETLSWIERRSREVVWADLCGMGAVGSSIAPAAPGGTSATDASPQSAN